MDTLVPRPAMILSDPDTGSMNVTYVADSVRMSGYGGKADGFYLFEPVSPKPDSAPVVVFNHGYASLNPMAYGEWIRHLVRQGNVVVFPNYQRNAFFPFPHRFARNVAKAYFDALDTLSRGDHVRPLPGPLVMAGHSYGGATAAFLGVKYQRYNLPPIKGLMLCAPGTGPLRGLRLGSYRKLPEDTRLIIVSSVNDVVVGERFQRRIFNTATNTPQRIFLRLYPDNSGQPGIRARHSECYSLNEAFDNGTRNPTIGRSFWIGRTDAADYFGYWKLMDALFACVRRHGDCDWLFSDTPQVRYLGKWPDGRPVKELEVILPGQPFGPIQR